MDAVLSRTGAALRPALKHLGHSLQSFAHKFGAGVDRYLNRLYENLPKDRPNV